MNKLVVFLHQAQVQGSAVADLVIDVVQTAGEQNSDAALDLGVFLSDAKLGERGDRSGADEGVFKHDAVVDVADKL